MLIILIIFEIIKYIFVNFLFCFVMVFLILNILIWVVEVMNLIVLDGIFFNYIILCSNFIGFWGGMEVGVLSCCFIFILIICVLNIKVWVL